METYFSFSFFLLECLLSQLSDYKIVSDQNPRCSYDLEDHQKECIVFCTLLNYIPLIEGCAIFLTGHFDDLKNCDERLKTFVAATFADVSLEKKVFLFYLASPKIKDLVKNPIRLILHNVVTSLRLYSKLPT